MRGDGLSLTRNERPQVEIVQCAGLSAVHLVAHLPLAMPTAEAFADTASPPIGRLSNHVVAKAGPPRCRGLGQVVLP